MNMHVHDVKIDDEPSCAASNRFSCRILLKIVDTKDNNISDLVNTCVFHNYTETFHGRGNTPMNFFLKLSYYVTQLSKYLPTTNTVCQFISRNFFCFLELVCDVKIHFVKYADTTRVRRASNWLANTLTHKRKDSLQICATNRHVRLPWTEWFSLSFTSVYVFPNKIVFFATLKK